MSNIAHVLSVDQLLFKLLKLGTKVVYSFLLIVHFSFHYVDQLFLLLVNSLNGL